MKTIYLSFIALFLVSCSLEHDPEPTCTQYLPTAIKTVVEKPNADAAGYLFDIGFEVLDSCGDFGSFEETIEGNVITIKLIAKYVGCNCQPGEQSRTTVYAFTQTTPGTYTLKFKATDDFYITKTVDIE